MKKKLDAKTVQQFMPIIENRADYPREGIIRSANGEYTKLYRIDDINFIVEDENMQSEIVDRYKKLLNHFPSNVNLSLIIVNQKVGDAQIADEFFIPLRGGDAPKGDIQAMSVEDRRDAYRNEYNERIVMGKVQEGRNDIRKSKYLLISIPCEDMKQALARFADIDNEMLSKLQDINSRQDVPALTVEERLRLMNHINKGLENVRFSDRVQGCFVCGNPIRKELGRTARSLTDIFCPFTISKVGMNAVCLGENRYCRSLCVTEYPRTGLDTRMLSDITDIPCEMVTTVALRQMSREKNIRFIRGTEADIDSEMDKHMRRAAGSGHDADLTINKNLREDKKEIGFLRESVIDCGDKLFLATLAVTMFDSDLEALKHDVMLFKSKIEDYSLTTVPLIGQQLAGLRLAECMGVNNLMRDYMFTSSSACAFFPYNMQEMQDAGGSLYGINAVTRSLIAINRKRLPLPNGFIFGRAGSGKSFIAKLEMLTNALRAGDDIIILDPENEYSALGAALGGSVVDIELKSDRFINPLDMAMEFDDPKATPVEDKCVYVVSLIETIIGRECTPLEINVVNHAVKAIYKPYVDYMYAVREAGGTIDIDTDKCPTLDDLYNELYKQDSSVGNDLALSCEQFFSTEGSFSLFSHRTNIKPSKENGLFLVYNLSNLKKNDKLHELAMKVCLSNISSVVGANSASGKATYIYIDEYNHLIKTEQSILTLEDFYKRMRKYYGIVTGITQDIIDLTVTKQGLTILGNCGFVIYMNQSPEGRSLVAQRLGASPALLSYINDKPRGTGLIYNGKSLVPFEFRIPSDTEIYRLITTDPNERKA